MAGDSREDNRVNKEAGDSKVSKGSREGSKEDGANRADNSQANKEGSKAAGVFLKLIHRLFLILEIHQIQEGKVAGVNKEANKEVNKAAKVVGVSQLNKVEHKVRKVAGVNKEASKEANKAGKAVGANQLNKVDKEDGDNKEEEDGNDVILLYDKQILVANSV